MRNRQRNRVLFWSKLFLAAVLCGVLAGILWQVERGGWRWYLWIGGFLLLCGFLAVREMRAARALRRIERQLEAEGVSLPDETAQPILPLAWNRQSLIAGLIALILIVVVFVVYFTGWMRPWLPDFGPAKP